MSRRAILTGVGAALAVLVLWYLFLWSPRSSALADARDRRESAEDQLQQVRLRLQRLEALQEDAPRLRSQIERLGVAIPDQPNLAQFILEANDAAARAGIDFISITPSEPSAGEAVGAPAQINLGITITGGYFQVLDYLNRLADIDRVVVVDTLGVSAGAEEDVGSVELSVTVSARMFLTEVTETADGVPTTTVAGATTTTTASP